MTDNSTLSRGVVVRLLPYGAMIRLEDGTTGLVHISEIDEKFVANVADYLAIGTRVMVKVIAVKEDGKVEFSIKRAKGAAPFSEEIEEFGSQEPIFYEPIHATRTGRAALDEKVREFLADATERLGDVRRHNETKLGMRRR
ncbi:S1 RNA-binding domain-containing protein [bacterium]|nr:MAG: S1 RNA-binding domain-containing protein [bacterium]